MKNNIFIISGPSGAGEDSVIKGLKTIIKTEKIITTTTRDPRPGEKNGREYYFISKNEFKKGINEGGFFEWAEEDNKQFYGCTFDEIERVKKLDIPVLWKIDYKGVITAKKIMPDATSIFIYIPIEKIKERLERRGNHKQNFIDSRLEYAQGWFENEEKFDYKIENKDGKLDETIKKLANIIKKNTKNP